MLVMNFGGREAIEYETRYFYTLQQPNKTKINTNP